MNKSSTIEVGSIVRDVIDDVLGIVTELHTRPAFDGGTLMVLMSISWLDGMETTETKDTIELVSA